MDTHFHAHAHTQWWFYTLTCAVLLNYTGSKTIKFSFVNSLWCNNKTLYCNCKFNTHWCFRVCVCACMCVCVYVHGACMWIAVSLSMHAPKSACSYLKAAIFHTGHPLNALCIFQGQTLSSHTHTHIRTHLCTLRSKAPSTRPHTPGHLPNQIPSLRSPPQLFLSSHTVSSSRNVPLNFVPPKP